MSEVVASRGYHGSHTDVDIGIYGRHPLRYSRP